MLHCMIVMIKNI